MVLPATFRVSDAIDDAFERIGYDPSGLVARHLVSARRSIRLLLDSWNNDSVDFWKVSSGIEQPCTVGMTDFTPAADLGVVDILRMTLKRNSYTTPMVAMAASDWFAISDKETVTGMPNRFWAERLIGSLTAHIYPKAENATDTIIYDAMVRSSDSSMLAAQADVPPLWNEAFASGLTFFLAQKFAPARIAEKQALYGGPLWRGPPGAYQVARMGNRERADTVMVPHKLRRPRR